jgi:hypothetical protein
VHSDAADVGAAAFDLAGMHPRSTRQSQPLKLGEKL